MSTSDDFFDDNEMKKEFNFKKYVLPQKIDCLLYVVSRTHTKSSNRISHDQAVRQMAGIVEKIWNDADCCPCTNRAIMKLFEEHVWKPYFHLKREKHLPGYSHPVQKRSHKKDPTNLKQQEPKRRSSRQAFSTRESNEKEVESISLPVPPMIEPPVKIRRTVSLRNIWDDEEGNKLFDVLSQKRVKKHSENKLYFDQTFYQKNIQSTSYVAE